MDLKINIIDAGARYGIHPSLKELNKTADFYLFEVDTKEADRLKNKYRDYDNIKVFNSGLYSSKTVLNINTLQHKGLSGSLEVNEEYSQEHKYMLNESQVVESFEVEADAIDNIFTDKNFHFIKLDTEGSEFEILKGAEKQLKENLLGLRIEVHFNRFYKDQVLFGEVNKFLMDYGFELLNLDYNGRGHFQSKYTDINRYGFLIACEAVWVKRRKFLFEKIKDDPVKVKENVIRMAVFLMLNNATDVAMDLLLTAIEHGLDFKEYKDSNIFRKLDKLVQILLKKLQYIPGIIEEDLLIYEKIFDAKLKKMHHFYESDIFNI